MSFPDAACIFCGATIRTFRDATWRSEWMCDYRALYTDSPDWTNVRLSGVGRWADIGGQYAPSEESVRYNDLDFHPRKLMHILLYKRRLEATTTVLRPSIGRSAWGFPVHASCWKLAEIVYGKENINKQRLFEICLSLPDSGRRVDWGYDRDLPASRSARREQHQEWDHRALCVNDPSLCMPIESDAQVFSPSEARMLCSSKADDAGLIAPAQQLDCFGRLPTEIRQMMLEYTRSKDVSSSKLASRSLALTPFPDSFWKSRFSSGNEFEHIFEAQEHTLRSIGWHNAYMYFKHVSLSADIHDLQPPNVTGSLENRRRIWDLLSSLQVLLTSRIPECHGQPIMSDYEQGESPQQLVWSTASRVLVKSGDLFTSGCRALRIRQVTIPSRLIAVSVSFVAIRGQKYISGLQFRSNGSPDELGDFVGYVLDGETVDFPLVAHSDTLICPSLRCLTVAMTMRGICGIRLLLQDGQDSEWIGEHEDIPKRRIVIKDSESLCLRVSLDAMKMVSLGIASLDDSNTMDPGPRLDMISGAYASHSDEAFWLPEVPPESVLLGGLCEMDSYTERQQEPYTMVLFGGEKGEHLSNLTQVFVWTYGSYVHGIEFVYGIGGPAPADRILGVRPRSEFLGLLEGVTTQVDHHEADKTALDIDGPGGERIIQITRHASGWGLLIGLRICTNFGRSIDMNCSDEREHEEEILEAEGRVIVGIYGLVEGKSGITSLGILSQDNGLALTSS